jgi:hypothetical protein
LHHLSGGWFGNEPFSPFRQMPQRRWERRQAAPSAREELYNKKVEDLIGVLKSKGVPVLGVGLPAIRGQKGTADMLFLDSLYRESSTRPVLPMSTSGQG